MKKPLSPTLGSMFALSLGLTCSTLAHSDDFEILQPLHDEVATIQGGDLQGYYVPSTLQTVSWGYLPNKNSKAVLTVNSGSVVTFDTLSHEGNLEDQGRDPLAYFTARGMKKSQVLEDGIAIAASSLKHDYDKDGPHIVTGPVAIHGAMPGDVLKVEILKLTPRVPYGVISNRHGKGALPGEYPKKAREAGASAEHPERYNNVSVFTAIEATENGYIGLIDAGDGKTIRFPLYPFMGIMGVAKNSEQPVHSVPPQHIGGNIDVNDLGEGTTVYLPIEVEGGLFYTGDGHFSQGDGEVALTALEGSVRATFKLTLLPQGKNVPGKTVTQPVGETDEFWITLGLDEDLNEAMKKSTRESIRFLVAQYGISEEIALAYLSAATNFEVSQVVDKTKGIHALIRKSDFAEFDDK